MIAFNYKGGRVVGITRPALLVTSNNLGAARASANELNVVLSRHDMNLLDVRPRVNANPSRAASLAHGIDGVLDLAEALPLL